MTDLSLRDIAKKMKDIDFVIMATHADGGQIASRPMSNNHDVDYNGDSFFFSLEENDVVDQIRREPKVGLALQGGKGLLGKPGIFLSIEGRAELIKDKAAFEQHWTHDMDRWAEQGPDTPGLVLIKVHASTIHYWDGEDTGEVRV